MEQTIIRAYPKKGKRYNPLHFRVDGKPGGIVDVKVGYRSYLWFYDDEDNRTHRIHTSNVRSVKEENDVTIVETQNTIYKIGEKV